MDMSNVINRRNRTNLENVIIHEGSFFFDRQLSGKLCLALQRERKLNSLEMAMKRIFLKSVFLNLESSYSNISMPLGLMLMCIIACKTIQLSKYSHNLKKTCQNADRVPRTRVMNVCELNTPLVKKVFCQ